MSERESNTLTAPVEPDASALDSAFSRTRPEPHEIDISFFSHKTRKSTSLVGNQLEENHIKARRAWLDFDLKDVIFITTIRVYATGYENYHEMDLSYVPYLSEEEKRLSVHFSDEYFTFAINDFTKGFGLRPSETGYFKTAKITKIQVSGIEKEHVTGIARFVQNIEREKSRIEESLSNYFIKAQKSFEEFETNEQAIKELDETIQEKTSEVGSLEAKIQELSRAHKKTQEEIEVASTVYGEQTKRSEAIQGAIDKLIDERKALTSNIFQRQAQLQELQANINLFPTELAGYVKQGTRNNRLYAALCVVPMAVIVYVTHRLFSNSERLLDTIQNLGQVSIFEFLISRLPYVAVSATILGICYTTLKSLISEIVAINRRRQELFKISIIATDVSYASRDGLDLTDDERYELLTQTKMELLKEHLRQNVGEDYTYSPRKTFMEHVKRLPVRKEQEEPPQDEEV